MTTGGVVCSPLTGRSSDERMGVTGGGGLWNTDTDAVWKSGDSDDDNDADRLSPFTLVFIHRRRRRLCSFEDSVALENRGDIEEEEEEEEDDMVRSSSTGGGGGG